MLLGLFSAVFTGFSVRLLPHPVPKNSAERVTTRAMSDVDRLFTADSLRHAFRGAKPQIVTNRSGSRFSCRILSHSLRRKRSRDERNEQSEAEPHHPSVSDTATAE